jgi:hypothetical protein
MKSPNKGTGGKHNDGSPMMFGCSEHIPKAFKVGKQYIPAPRKEGGVQSLKSIVKKVVKNK